MHRGALLRAEGGSRIDIDSCKVTECGSDGEGGAIFASDSDLDISGSHFGYLRSESSGGGLALVTGRQIKGHFDAKHIHPLLGRQSRRVRVRLECVIERHGQDDFLLQ